jgi:hypothetical protein
MFSVTNFNQTNIQKKYHTWGDLNENVIFSCSEQWKSHKTMENTCTHTFSLSGMQSEDGVVMVS